MSPRTLAALLTISVAASNAPPPLAQEEDPAEKWREELAAWQDAKDREAWRTCRELKGYAELRKAFEVERATRGSVNGFEESLFVNLRTTASGLLNAARWWNPEDVGGSLRHDWSDFLEVYREAAQVLEEQEWVLEWRDASPGRVVELQAFGEGIGETQFELETFIIPIWREAGLAGLPEYSFLLRRNDSAWATLYLGTADARALVGSVSEPDASSPHWLDGLEVYYHPRCTPGDRSSRYALVDPSGQWEVRTVRACES